LRKGNKYTAWDCIYKKCQTCCLLLIFNIGLS
jgi:hypothetical protein